MAWHPDQGTRAPASSWSRWWGVLAAWLAPFWSLAGIVAVAVVRDCIEIIGPSYGDAGGPRQVSWSPRRGRYAA
jgi:hypothetical protein